MRAIEEHGSVNAASIVFVTRSGAPRHAAALAARFEMAGKATWCSTANDITETERARREHEAILQSAPVGIAFVRDGHFQRVNPSWERMFGWDPGAWTANPWPRSGPTHWTMPEVRRPPVPDGERDAPPVRARDAPRAGQLLVQTDRSGSPRDTAVRWRHAVDRQDVTARRRVERRCTCRGARSRPGGEPGQSAFLANTSHEIPHAAERTARPGADGCSGRPSNWRASST